MSLFLVVMLYSFLTVQDEMTDAADRSTTASPCCTSGARRATADRLRRPHSPQSRASTVAIAHVVVRRQLSRGEDAVRPVRDRSQDYLRRLSRSTSSARPAQGLAERRPAASSARVIARNKGWKIGDKIPLQGQHLSGRPRADGPRHLRRPSTRSTARWLVVPLRVLRRVAQGSSNDPNAGNAGIVMLRADVGRRRCRP